MGVDETRGGLEISCFDVEVLLAIGRVPKGLVPRGLVGRGLVAEGLLAGGFVTGTFVTEGRVGLTGISLVGTAFEVGGFGAGFEAGVLEETTFRSFMVAALSEEDAPSTVVTEDSGGSKVSVVVSTFSPSVELMRVSQDLLRSLVTVVVDTVSTSFELLCVCRVLLRFFVTARVDKLASGTVV